MEKNTKGTRRIVQVLNEIKEAIEKHTRAHRPQDERQQEKRNVPLEVRAEVRFDDQTIGNESGDKDKDRRIQSSIKRAAWSAFFAASIYAGIAAYQAKQMKLATIATQSAALAAQDQAIAFEKAESAQLIVEVTPVGKSGALNATSGPNGTLLVDWDVAATNVGPTMAKGLNFTFTFFDIANTNGSYVEPPNFPFSKLVPNPSPIGQAVRQNDTIHFKAKQQITTSPKNTAVIYMQVSFVNIFNQADFAPVCLYYSQPRQGFIRCP